MRNAFADEITKIANEDPRVTMLSGDIGNRLFDRFKEQNPRQFFNCGVAEANMIGVASGMALSGLRPIAYTIAPFITSRVFEQIKVDLCYQGAPAIIVSVGGGLSYASLGPTHHSLEDIAILRSLPDIKIVCPADAYAVRAALRQALKETKPVYIRLGKKNEPLVYSDVPEDFLIGRARFLSEGRDVCLIGAGNIVPNVVEASKILHQRGVSSSVVDMHTVKPLDREFLAVAASRHSLIVTIEEHGIHGGLGSAVIEELNDMGDNVRVLRIAVPDKFIHESASQQTMRTWFGLDADGIAKTVMSEVEKLASS